jgi:hypothetical protein
LATGGWWAAQGVGVVGVAAEFAVAGDDPGAVFPVGARRVVGVGDGAEGFDGPGRRLFGGVAAELGGAFVGGGGEGGEVGVPDLVVGAG